MLTTMSGLYAATAAGLGSYNIARFLARRAIKIRRARKKERARDAKLDAAIDVATKIYERAKSGEIENEKIQDVLAYVKDTLK